MTIEFRDYRPLALAQMNREHEEFANLLNEAEQALLMGRAGLPYLHRVYEHCQQHFAQEEHDMEYLHFPAFAAHRHEHQRILQLFTDALAGYERSGDITGILELLMDTIPDWFGQHMNNYDRALSQFLAQQEQKQDHKRAH
ncbi:MAG: hypothetical protein LRY66_17380 [Saccharospirillaceae bacterium]|nr:hypothetical protein [Saccharospirillaceae bacterium]MCD8533076.1 hypothetical protein [Saccharospirillaceae bacterium]